MGGVASRCSDVSMDKGGSAKPLDASSSEEDDEEDDDEDEEDEEDDGEDQKEAEAALHEGLKRGKTTAFKEVIDHATAIGIDEDKIMKAEAMLEQHKATRRREAFEQELVSFMDTPEAESLEKCEQRLRQGEGYGVTEKAMQPLVEKIEELKMQRDLGQDETLQAKNYLEACVRRFVAAAVLGRSTTWVDQSSGKLQKVNLALDLALKYVKILSITGEVLQSAKLTDCVPKKPQDAEEIIESGAFEKLTDFQRELCVGLLGCADDPWIFVEDDIRKLDDFIVAFTVLNGIGLNDGPSSPKGKKGKDKDKKDKKKKEDSPRSPRASQSPRGDEDEEGLVSPRRNRRNSTQHAEVQDLEEAVAEDAKEKDKKDKKDKKEKKEKKEKKQKGSDDDSDDGDKSGDNSADKDDQSLKFDDPETKDVVGAITSLVESKGGKAKAEDIFEEVRMHQLAKLFDHKVRLYIVLVALCGDKMDAKSLATHKKVVTHLIENGKMPAADILWTFDAYLSQNSAAQKGFPMVLKAIYDEEWVGEPAILAYYNEDEGSGEPGFDEAKKSAAPFLKWLATAGSDDDDSDDDDDESDD